MKRFNKHSNLILTAIANVEKRQAAKAREDKKTFLANLKKNNFLQWAAGVAQGIIK
jgi:hypothetical protein